MPVTFLSKEHKRRYGRFEGDPNSEQLARCLNLDDADVTRVRRLRLAHIQLGFALQLCTVRFLGTFLSSPTAVPKGTVWHVAAQLRIRNPKVFKRYTKQQTQWKHARQINSHYGYLDLGDRNEGFRLVRRLYSRAWKSEELPTSVLLDLTLARVIERKVLLPGAITLERLVARERTARRLWRRLASLASEE